MNKGVAILLTIWSLAALKEFYRVCTSPAPDIVHARPGLIVLLFTMCVLSIYFTIRYWKKAYPKNRPGGL